MPSQKLRDLLFYESDTSDSHYGNLPTDSLSVSQLLQGKPYWRAPFGSIIRHPKAVLVHPTLLASFVTPESKIIASERLQDLQAEGISLYQYDTRHKGIIKLNPKSLLRNNFTLPDSMDSDKDMMKTMGAQLELSVEQRYLLDDKLREELLNGDDSDWNQLTSFKIVDLKESNLNSLSLTSLLNTHGHEIESLDLSLCINLTAIDSAPSLPFLQTLKLGGIQYAQIADQQTYRKCTLTIQAIFTLLKQAPALTLLDLSSLDIFELAPFLSNSLSLPSLETLDLNYSNISSESLGQLLVKTTALKSLDLHDCKELSGLLPDHLNLTSLESLDLRRSNISSKSLGQLLTKTTALKSLDLRGCKELSGLLPDHLNLTSLEVLNLSGSNISSKSLSQLLTKTTALKSLDLGYYACNELSGLLPGNLNLTSSLESLDLSFSNISSKSLGQLLTKTTALKSLDLRGCKELSGLLPDHLNLTSLESLDLCFSNISSKSLGKLLTKTTALKSLDLRGCKELSGLLPDHLNLTSLESLDLSRSNISSESLGQLLAKTTALKSLDLHDCEKLSGILPENLNLASLELLNLSGSNISSKSLDQLLTKTTALKSLDLRGCKELSGLLPDHLNLTSLELLNLSNSNISSKSLGQLLTKTTALKSLDLGGSQQLSELLPDNLNLTSLESLDLSFSNISSKSLGQLLTKTTALKSLKLHGCKELSGLLPDHLNLTSLESLNLSGSNISSKSLGQLLTKTTALKSLDLHDCKKLSGLLPDHLNLTSLELLNLSNSNISSKSLGQLLTKTTALKSLDLSNCKELSGLLPDHLNLTSLELLNLSRSNISSESLGQLLTKTTVLKALDLRGCQELSGLLPDNLNLTSLESLDLSYSNITVENIGKLLAKADALKNLRLPYIDSGHLRRLLQETNPAILHLLPSTQNAPKTQSIVQSGSGHSPSSHWADSKSSLDANTIPVPINQTVHAIAYFFDKTNHIPAVSQYRLSVYSAIKVSDVSCDMGSAFELSHQDPLGLIETPATQERTNLFSTLPNVPLPEKKHYYAKKTLYLTSEWQALPSLSAKETLLKYHLSQDVPVNIRYSTRDNLYYIQSGDGLSHTVDIDFTISIPTQSPAELPPEVKELVTFCQSFGEKALHMDKYSPTGKDYLQALITQKVGACRHRTLVFKALMQEKHPNYPVRIINNDCHSMVEIKIDKGWGSCDLGGYPAELIVNQAARPKATDVVEQDPSTTKAKDVVEQEPSATNSADIVVQHLSATSSIENITSYFAPEPAKPLSSSITHYLQTILEHPNAQKHLLTVTEYDALSGLRYHLEHYCHMNQKHPYMYIHSPEDLICSSACIQRKPDNTGIIQPQGSALHAFLSQHREDGTTPVLIINYANFSASDVVRFNAILDPKPHADGTPLPKKTRVIGLLMPEKEGAYTGADFYSRFDDIASPPLPLSQFAAPPLVDTSKTPNSDALAIELFGGNDWEAQLLGHWDLRGNKLFFIEGALLRALKEGKTNIRLHNAPWHNDAFVSFWQNALLTQRISCYGEGIDLPASFTLHQQNGYTSIKNDNITLADSKKPVPLNTLVLNPATFSRFLGSYAWTDNVGLESKPGLLERHSQQTITVYVSHSLPTSVWTQWLSMCKEHQVKVNLLLAEGVTLPAEWGLSTTPIKTSRARWCRKYPRTAHCQSSCPDTTIALLPQNPERVVLDISEINPADLIQKIDGQFDTKTASFCFREEEGLLSKLLRQGKDVVLTGVLSAELQQHLSELMFVRSQQKSPSGTLLLVSHSPLSCPLTPGFSHDVTIAEKKEAFAAIDRSLTDETIQQHTLPELRAMTLAKNKQAPWLGMHSIVLKPFSARSRNEAKESNAFDAQRLSQVETHLEQSPFVFLAGLTGVGKTTFIDKVWRKKYPALHVDCHAWANDKTPGYKTLFIDEANISSRQWSEFESLWATPPFIRINNQMMPLTKDHKVIFAGNPISYGDERQLPSLFKRHGNSLIFDPIPPAYVSHTLLRPALKDMPNGDAVVTRILAVYDYLTSISTDKILLSPRELTTMALLTSTFCKQQPDLVAAYYAHTLSRPFVPQHKQAEFDTLFKTESTHRLAPRETTLSSSMVINNTNRPGWQILNDFLALRQARRFDNERTLLQQYGGLGGVILEGEPGAGKSELVLEALRENGLSVRQLQGPLEQQTSGFYHVPVSTPLSDKKALLCKAFYEGSVVVIDEINSSPMMERFLNALLMGNVPEDDAISAQIADYKKASITPKPGFLLIGTQNSAQLNGRRKASEALAHRMHTVHLHHYTHADLVEILTTKGLQESVAKPMVTEYMALRQTDNSRLCFRDLLRCAMRFKSHQPLQTSPASQAPSSTNGNAFFSSTRTPKKHTSEELAILYFD